MKIGNGEVQRLAYDVTHPDILRLAFTVAGKQFNYPGFNGQLFNINFKAGAGAYLDNTDQFVRYLATQDAPPSDLNKQVVIP